MSKNIYITGLVYNSGKSRVVDYGFGVLFKSDSNASGLLENSRCIKDDSFCPPLYDNLTLEFLTDVDYKAKIVSVDPSNSWVRVLVNGVLGVVYFDHLARYWGSLQCIYENYRKDDEIDVRYVTTKTKSNNKPGVISFKETGVRIVPFTSFNYKVGDSVDICIGPTDGKKSLVWFNGQTIEILPVYDPVFQRRVLNHVYFPGKPIVAVVTRVDDSKPGKKFFNFSVLHSRVDYGLHVGNYPCLIGEQYGIKYAFIKTEINGAPTTFCFEIPQTEIPNDFPRFDKTRIPTAIRISGFDELGEPQIHFKSLMDKLFSVHEGESFDIKLVKPNDQASKYRIWTGGENLCGLVSKIALSSLGDKTAGLYGKIVDGILHVSLRGDKILPIAVNDVLQATIVHRHNSYYDISVNDRQALLFNIDKVNETVESINVKIVHIDYLSSLVICVPDASPLPSVSFEKDERISLRVITVANEYVILGDSVHLGIMPITNWDWSGGKTIVQHLDNSLYVEVSIQEVTDTGVLILERRSLIDNPWNHVSIEKGQVVKAHIERITNSTVTVSLNGIVNDIKWSHFCPYEYSYGQYLFMVGTDIKMNVDSIDTLKGLISLTYLPEDSLPKNLFFDKNNDYPATIIKLIPQGILVRVNNVYGVIPKKFMLKESQYTTDNQTINVRFIKRSFVASQYYFEFSHIATIDTSNIIRYGNVVQSAVLEKKDINWLTFSVDGVQIFCHRNYAKYFSADRDFSFVEKMIPGQSFNLRITDVQNRRAVPAGMPDYSSLCTGKEYDGHVYDILDDAYLVFIDELKDIFYIPFKGYCDWGSYHFETRKREDAIKVTMISYSYSHNIPYFSLIEGKEDPWATLSEGETIKVDVLGSIHKENDFFVNVNGIPVLLSTEAICALIGKPWIGEALSYISIKRLEENAHFTMDIISINKKVYHMVLMPHVDTYPKSVHKAQVIHRLKNNIWVRCGTNLTGYLPEEEIPEGFIIGDTLDQAICKSFIREKGYVLLSIKDLFVQEHDNDKEDDIIEKQLKGVIVTEETGLREKLIVRGTVKGIDNKRNRYFINVGPYLGIVSYLELSHLFCDAPGFALEKGKEYDFSISKIYDNPDGKLLILSRKPLMPYPPKDISIGVQVHARVLRYMSSREKENEIIVVSLKEYDNVEAVINPSDLNGCRIDNKTFFPSLGYLFTAEISKIEKNKLGQITRIRLAKGI